MHVKNRCAWLNHSSDPTRFLRLLGAHPNVRLWFSGHFHLSHNYADSISVVGGCAFVQVGVIGECHRDGFRQSRVLKGERGRFLVGLRGRYLFLRGDFVSGWVAGNEGMTVLGRSNGVKVVAVRVSGW